MISFFFFFFGLAYLIKICIFFLQPLFPGESGVDQLVEIIKVIFVISNFLYCCYILFASVLNC